MTDHFATGAISPQRSKAIRQEPFSLTSNVEDDLVHVSPNTFTATRAIWLGPIRGILAVTASVVLQRTQFSRDRHYSVYSSLAMSWDL